VGAAGGPWYGPQGSLGPEPQDYRPTGPITPIKPRSERGNKFLRYLLAVLLLVVVVGGGAFAVSKFLDKDDEPDQSDLAVVTTPTQVNAPPATATTQTAAEPTQTPEPAEPTPTEEAAAEPTEDGGAEQEAAAAEPTQAEEQQSSETTVQSADALLPAADELEGDWVVDEEGERSKTEVGDQLGPEGEAQLTNWRWRENVYRNFQRQNPEQFPEEATNLSVSVHRFANTEGAQEALQGLADILAAGGLQDVEAPAIGNAARSLAGSTEGANLYVLYVQDDKYLIRLGGTSAAGDPAPIVNALAEQIVSG
jgi:hypothetical protein